MALCQSECGRKATHHIGSLFVCGLCFEGIRLLKEMSSKEKGKRFLNLCDRLAKLKITEEELDKKSVELFGTTDLDPDQVFEVMETVSLEHLQIKSKGF